MPNRRPDPARERLWRKRLASWKASGLKVSEFCEREGITPTAFAHWRKTLRARDAQATAADTNTFVPIHITPTIAVVPLDVTLVGGRVVRVPPGFDPAHLRAVVALLVVRHSSFVRLNDRV
jgi:hypothetical protein